MFEWHGLCRAGLCHSPHPSMCLQEHDHCHIRLSFGISNDDQGPLAFTGCQVWIRVGRRIGSRAIANFNMSPNISIINQSSINQSINQKDQSKGQNSRLADYSFFSRATHCNLCNGGGGSHEPQLGFGRCGHRRAETAWAHARAMRPCLEHAARTEADDIFANFINKK